jgi:hypothetical protein
MLWSEEQVWSEPCYPMRQRDDEVALVFLVHCGLHLGELLVDRGVVTEAPVEECISPRGLGYELVRATHEHDTSVFSNKCTAYFKCV